MERLNACVDVDYRGEEAVAACLLFRHWKDAQPLEARTARVSPVAPYEPGQFYRRELPCLLAVLSPLLPQLGTVVVDGHVWLSPGQPPAPGLGAHLYAALGEQVGVIGVAKTAYRGAPAVEVQRGVGTRPLYVTATGIAIMDAARHVQQMHGPHRLPTLLKRVDQLCRRA
ncbi:endonuclease V [Deinococcus hopiensis]|uniref:Endonuclease V n=1 Tax=Deinococcus hopiensis KR-140 TaxID=695939 RepID=A0A1W1VNX1_9DEIO|nr:endonuclease V [Deinococcus hopiensis]SMB94963.1 Endonuclease V [Deinococcus hopiensis KR-140]